MKSASNFASNGIRQDYIHEKSIFSPNYALIMRLVITKVDTEGHSRRISLPTCLNFFLIPSPDCHNLTLPQFNTFPTLEGGKDTMTVRYTTASRVQFCSVFILFKFSLSSSYSFFFLFPFRSTTESIPRDCIIS